MPCGNTSSMPAPDVIGPILGRKAPRTRRYEGWRVISAHCLCANGLSFEVCVGEDRECWPRSEDGPWTHAEVTGLNRSLSSMERYRFMTGDGTSAVSRYAKVPIGDLNRLIARNGGLV